MERDPDPTTFGQKTETGEIDRDEDLNANATGERAGQPKQGDNAKDTRIGIVNEANFGTD
jgi:hypothetical protein